MPKGLREWIPIILGVLLIGGVIFSFWYQNQLKVNETPINQSTKKPCVVGGCNGQLCLEESVEAVTTCEWSEEYECYKDAKCERQENGECGWTMDEKLRSCLDEKMPKL